MRPTDPTFPAPAALAALPTPSLLLDVPRMDRNVARMRARLARLGVPLRPHVKTCKSDRVARRILGGTPGPITVSTLREAAEFAALGYTDILYAVGIVPSKLPQVIAMRRQGTDLALVLDDAEVARAVAAAADAAGVTLRVLLEIDCDGHRSGLAPDSDALLEVADALRSPQVVVDGVMTHAGESYSCRSDDALRAMAEQERAAAVRAGVFVFFDLVMAGIGVCRTDELALSVLTTVIGHQRDKGWAIVDAGWMAMSRDRGTASQPLDQGYGLVCDAEGRELPGLLLCSANQEHGIVGRRDGAPGPMPELPVGTLLRILPNHACATAAQFDGYRALGAQGGGSEWWARFRGW